jgi:hypothetical protein
MLDTARPSANLLPSSFCDRPDARRLAIRQLLSVSAPALLGLYEAAVRMVQDEQFPARRHLIAHCVREIANSFPSFFAGSMQGYVDYQQLVQAIVELWTEAGLPVGTEAAPVSVTGNGADGAPPTVLVPQPIVRRMSKLLEAHSAVYGRRHHNAALLFHALSPDPDGDTYHLRPTITLCLDTSNWFQARAHHNRRSEDFGNGALEPEFISRFHAYPVEAQGHNPCLPAVGHGRARPGHPRL